MEWQRIMDQDDIDRELFELEREWMEVSKLKKLPGHVAKETDVSLWKQYGDRINKKSGVRIRAFRCPLKHRTGCGAGIRIQYGQGLISVASTRQTVTIVIGPNISSTTRLLPFRSNFSDAVTIAPQLSAAHLRRNMQLADSLSKKIAPELLQSVQNWVKMSRAQWTMKQLDGFDINSS